MPKLRANPDVLLLLLQYSVYIEVYSYSYTFLYTGYVDTEGHPQSSTKCKKCAFIPMIAFTFKVQCFRCLLWNFFCLMVSNIWHTVDVSINNPCDHLCCALQILPEWSTCPRSFMSHGNCQGSSAAQWMPTHLWRQWSGRKTATHSEWRRSAWLRAALSQVQIPVITVLFIEVQYRGAPIASRVLGLHQIRLLSTHTRQLK